MNKNKFLITLGTLGAISVPAFITMSCASQIKSNTKIKFDRKSFSTKNELSNYINKNYVPNQDGSGTWSLNIDGENSYYNSPSQAYAEFDKHIDEKEVYLPRDIKSFTDDSGRILNYPSSSSTHSIETIYRGAHGNYYLSKKAAIKSLLEIHNAYNYNGIYFRNKNDLRDYLIKHPAQVKSYFNADNFSFLKDSNGHISNKLEKSNKFQIEDFVKNNAVRGISNYQGNFIESSKITTNYIPANNMNILHIDNTHGKASYVVDINKDTPGSLIGPEILESEVNPTDLINRDVKRTWFKSAQTSSQKQYRPANILNEKMLDLQVISSLPHAFGTISSLMSLNSHQDKEYTSKYPNSPQDFSTLPNLLNSYKVNFGTHKSILLWDAFKLVEKELNKGKQAGFIRNMVILRSWLLNKAVLLKMNNTLMTKINNDFDFVTKLLMHIYIKDWILYYQYLQNHLIYQQCLILAEG